MITAFLYLSPSTRRFFLPERETDQGKASGFTLVELLVAMCVSLLLLGGVVSLFGSLGESVNNSKSNSEMLQTMRHAARQLQSDLGNVSLVPDPAQTMVDPQGFFEYVEGPQNDANLKPEPVAELPDPIILDDGGSSFTAVSDGTNNIFKPFTSSRAKRKSYSNTVHEKNSKYLKNEGLFEATGLENGTYKVSLTWPIEWNTVTGELNWANRTETSVPVSVSSGGAAPQATTVDQSQAPSSFDDPEGEVNDYGEIIKWQDIGEVDVTDGEITVQIGPCGAANGYTTSNLRVFADAIRIECLELTGGGTEEGQVAQMSLTGDCDDVLHFTTKTDEGAHEVVWFLTPMKGHENKPAADKRYRLHRYARPVDPSIDHLTTDDYSFSADGTPNSLSDLTRRENRFAHKSGDSQHDAIPHSDYQIYLNKESLNPDDSTKWAEGERTRKTVILENVIGFDVQAYDPTAPIYSTTASNGQTVSLLPTDLGWTAEHKAALAAIENDPDMNSVFDLATATDVNLRNLAPIGKGAFRDLDPTQSDDTHSPLQTLNTANGFVATYDSWSGDYIKTFDHDENSGTEEVPGDVGFDNDGNGIVDTAEDLRESPPYNAPLKAVQVEIRMQEPESGKVRSVKVRKFLGKR